jgi:hypothetical protein
MRSYVGRKNRYNSIDAGKSVPWRNWKIRVVYRYCWWRIQCLSCISKYSSVYAISLINSMEQSISWKSNSMLNHSRNFLHFMEPKVHSIFTTGHHQSLSWARWIQSTPSNPISLRFIYISQIILISRNICFLWTPVKSLTFEGYC